jgi:Domain of unknown function (DUF4865)
MDVSQYGIALPADYDMALLRERSAAVWPTFDDRAGLGLKAYLIRDRGQLGSPVNEYGALYLWNEPGEMARFLVGGAGFERIVRVFGRVSVGMWTGLATVAGPARGAAPKSASRRLTTLPADPDRRHGPGPERSHRPRDRGVDGAGRAGGRAHRGARAGPGAVATAAFRAVAGRRAAR